MFDFAGLLLGFQVAFNPVNLLWCFIGSVLGTAVGVLPGLGPAATIALLLPISMKMGSPVTAIILMAGIFYGAMYGGSTTSILLNLPGEAASVVTCIDGYQMARKGRAGPALGVAAIASFIAGTFGVVGMTVMAPPLAEFALKFGPPEYFALTVLGLLLATYLTGDSPLKGLTMAIFGLILGSVGLDPLSGAVRFDFGVPDLQSNIDFVTVAMGLFGVGEILINLEQAEAASILTTKIKNVFPTMADLARSGWAMVRGSFIGFGVGILPGGGAVLSSLISYAVEKKCSRHPEEFGQGAIEGVAGPEAANNSAASSSFIPLLTLGIPGNASTAMIFAALLIHGITPGPFLLKEHASVFWGVIASMYIGNIMLLILNLPLVGM
ncbi:MAG TPA: tripartite tricarboxylate transporter permease, partial [Candidatus Methylomirabilis sp.]|nr:tripartite tricarboxylate transporter permease [Candidatus Methylomirabilis sp.]